VIEPAEGALRRLAERGGAPFAHLLAARERTAQELVDLRARTAAVPLPADAAIVMFGSWGRHEVTRRSDHDWVLLVDDRPAAGDGDDDGASAERREDVARAVEAVGRVLGVDERRPGAQQVFGDAVSGERIVRRIGLDADTNRNLTHRMLLVLESQPVAHDAVHRACWERVLDRYLDDRSLRDHRPPRFFLNDVIRYWRTICVDFAGKLQEGGGDKWALRNAKLRTSRKVLFAGGLLPILLCHNVTRSEVRAFLAEQLAAPPTDRLAAAFLTLGAVDPGVRALTAYDRFVGMLDDDAVRRELDGLDRVNADRSRVYREIRRQAEELQQGLLALLFETPLLPYVRQYGIF
jgi:hypothetical protein